jgi:protein-L-isoaspartate(D-aspartate) O-methyltransferase
MTATNPWRLKKFYTNSIFLTIILCLFTIILQTGCAKEPEKIASSQNQKPDTNQAEIQTEQEEKALYPEEIASSQNEKPDTNQAETQTEQEEKAHYPEKIVSSQDRKSDTNQAEIQTGQEEKAHDDKVKTHPAFTERIEERNEMVDRQIRARDIKDPNVLRAMRTVPRHAFVPFNQLPYAYGDYPRPIGFDQTISQPYIVAFMTEALQLKPHYKVLEIGTGSGYQAAVCAEIADKVYTIEIVKGLAKRAKKDLAELGYENVFVRFGDGFFGWPKEAPFDAIIGTAAAGRIPEPLIEQLKPGGRMILPYGSPWGYQYLVVVTKDKNGKIHKNNIMPVRFVPMTGEVMKPEKKSGK